MSRTPTGLIVHWPDMDLSPILGNRASSRMVSAFLEEIPQNPFQQGRDLASEDAATTELIPYTDNSKSHDPGRELYAGAGGAGEHSPPQRQGEILPNIQELEDDFNNNGGIFGSPTANIISARHMLDGMQASLELAKKKEIL